LCGLFHARWFAQSAYTAALQPPTNGQVACSYLGASAFGHTLTRSTHMLKYAIIFAIISLIAGLFGFTGIAAGAAGIAKVLFILFLILAVIFVVLAAMGVGAARKIMNK
jgi:uncharacterized membrane protein YtjA (UPF0391 family)